MTRMGPTFKHFQRATYFRVSLASDQATRSYVPMQAWEPTSAWNGTSRQKIFCLFRFLGTPGDAWGRLCLGTGIWADPPPSFQGGISVGVRRGLGISNQ